MEMKRTFNIIERAVFDFSLEIDMNDSMQEIFDAAQNAICDGTSYDYISECERSRHYDHISWNDGKGFDYEADGQFISSDDRHNHYFRYENGIYREIEWFDHTNQDYVLVDYVLDSDGQKVALVCK